jgi:hypothetical protein
MPCLHPSIAWGHRERFTLLVSDAGEIVLESTTLHVTPEPDDPDGRGGPDLRNA